MMTIDTTNMCSHLQKKLFEEDGIYLYRNYLLKFCLRKSLGDFPKARRQNLPKNERFGKPSSSAISFTERSVFSR